MLTLRPALFHAVLWTWGGGVSDETMKKNVEEVGWGRTVDSGALQRNSHALLLRIKITSSVLHLNLRFQSFHVHCIICFVVLRTGVICGQ